MKEPTISRDFSYVWATEPEMRPTLLTLIGLFLVCGFSQMSVAQNNDELYKQWNNNSLEDSLRMHAANQYSRNLVQTDQDSARAIAESLLRFAEDKKELDFQIEALTTMGSSYYYQSEYVKALSQYMAALDLANLLKDQRKIASSYNNVGIMYDLLGDYPKALEYYQKSLSIKLDGNFEQGLAVTYSNIGAIYLLQNKHEDALEYFEKSLEIDKKAKNETGMAGSYNQMGTAYSQKGDASKAQEYFSMSIGLYEALGDQEGKAIALNNIGNLFKRNGDYDKALEYFKQSLKIHEAGSDLKATAIAQTNIGKVYNQKRNYDEAIKYCDKSYEIGEKQNLAQQWFDACECLYLAFKKKNKEEYALDYMERMMMLKDQLSSDQTDDKLKSLEYAKELQMQQISFRNDSLQKEEEKLKMELAHREEVAQSKKTRNYLMIGGLIAFIIAGGLLAQLRVVRKSRKIISKERDRSDELLLNILPEEIAKELKEKGFAAAKNHDKVTILFTDFKEFTQTSEKLSATELVMEINACFEAFDRIMEKYNVEKIKTIGDAYMAAGGLPVPESGSVVHTVLAALEMQLFITHRKKIKEAENKIAFEMRVGIHTGSAVAGIVGVKKFQYDIWGDTVNTAARMESTGMVGRVNISRDTYDVIKEDPHFVFEHRGKIEAKHKGAIDMYFVSFAEGQAPDPLVIEDHESAFV